MPGVRSTTGTRTCPLRRGPSSPTSGLSCADLVQVISAAMGPEDNGGFVVDNDGRFAVKRWIERLADHLEQIEAKE